MSQAVSKKKFNIILGAQAGSDEKEKVLNKLAKDVEVIYYCEVS